MATKEIKKALMMVSMMAILCLSFTAMAKDPTVGQLNELHGLIQSGQITYDKLETFLQQNRPQPPQKAIGSFANLIPEGWTVVENVVPSLSKFSGLELVSYLNKGEDYIDNNEMRGRAKRLKADLGLDDAIYLLEHQDKIPVEMQDKFLIFPGTFLRGPGGGLDVPCLRWSGGRWDLSFGWLDNDWNDNGRLVRGNSLCSPPNIGGVCF